MGIIKTGDLSPDFKLPDQNGKLHTLSYHRGQWVLLYFYPKDDTPGCTAEACAIRDAFPDFGKLGITVFGVSTDSVESHKKFAAKHYLPFSLLSDTEKITVGDYGVYGEKSIAGKKYMGIFRTSFLINPEGKVAKVYERVKPELHPAEVLKDLKLLMNKSSSRY